MNQLNDLHKPENLKVRDEWIANQNYSTAQFDKNVLWVAAGGFTIASVFIDKIIPLVEATFKWLLIAACICFGLAILLSLYSHFRAMRREGWKIDNYESYVNDYEEFEKSYEQKRGGVKNLNNFQFLTLIGGCIALILFIAMNINHKISTAQTGSASIEQIRGLQGNSLVPPVKNNGTTNQSSGGKQK